MIWVIVLGCLATAGVMVLMVLAIGVQNKIDDVLIKTRALEEHREQLKELKPHIKYGLSLYL